MAFVPEIDDPNKKYDDLNASSITEQANPSAAPTVSAPPPTPGQAPAASATKSSGNFQDFSKFKAANQNKLSALSNLSLDTADKTLNDAGSAFKNAGSAYQNKIKENAQNFDTSGFANLNSNSTIDADNLSGSLANARKQVDAGDPKGKLAGESSFAGLQSAENLVSNLPGRAGTAQVLGGSDEFKKAGVSADAASSDSLLLNSTGNYRTQANAKAQAAKGVANSALVTEQADIDKATTDVNNQNKIFVTKALDKLKGVKTGIDTDLTTKAEATEADRQRNISKVTSDVGGAANRSLAQKLEKLESQPLGEMRPGPNGLEWVPTEAGKEHSRLSALTPEQRVAEFGGDVALNKLKAGTTTATQILNKDPAKRAQLDALSRLLSPEEFGATYNDGGIAPTNDMSEVERLIASVGPAQNVFRPERLTPASQTATGPTYAAPINRTTVVPPPPTMRVLPNATDGNIKAPVTKRKTSTTR